MELQGISFFGSCRSCAPRTRAPSDSASVYVNGAPDAGSVCVHGASASDYVYVYGASDAASVYVCGASDFGYVYVYGVLCIRIWSAVLQVAVVAAHPAREPLQPLVCRPRIRSSIYVYRPRV